MKITLASALVVSFLLCGCSARERVQNHIPANAGIYEDAEGYAGLSMLLGGASQETHAAVIRINLGTHLEATGGVNPLVYCTKIPEDFPDAPNHYHPYAT